MLILNEVYREGLDNAEEFKIESLDYYRDSFMAFQVLIDIIEEEAIFNLSRRFEYTIENLPNYFLYIKGAQLSFVESVNTEVKPMGDILSNKKIKRVSQKQRINIFIYLDDFDMKRDKIKVTLCRREFIGKETKLIEKCILVNNCGVLGITKKKNLELWQHPTTLARYYGMEPYSDDFFYLLENFIESLSKLGVRSITAILSDAPWNGQVPLLGKNNLSNLYENNMVYVEVSPFKVDFSALDRYINLCFKYGIDEEINVFGLIGVWTHEEILVSSSTRILNSEEIELYREAIYQHFIDKHYIDKAFICIDEPKDVKKLKKEISYIREKYPEFKIKCAFDKEEIAKEIMPLVDKSSISFYLAAKGYKADSWYICCGPDTPNSFISSELIEVRSLAYLSKKFGIKNILRWSYMAFTERPNYDARFGNFRAGDTYLIYPNNLGKVNLSLRYIQFLRLVEEMALLENDTSIYKKIFNIEDTKKVLLKDYQVVKDFFIKDYNFYVGLRRELSNKNNSLS